MRDSKAQRRQRLIERLTRAGFSFDEVQTLRRIEMTLHAWGERECNGTIRRDDDTDKPRAYYETSNGEHRRGGIVADRERGALKRLAKLMAAHSDYLSYYQMDPRGCSLYVVPKSELARTGHTIDACYSQGIAVCD